MIALLTQVSSGPWAREVVRRECVARKLLLFPSWTMGPSLMGKGHSVRFMSI